MYIRRTTRRVGGKTYHNHLLVESVATPHGPRQRVICSLGALAPGAQGAWLGLAQKLHAALAGQTALVPGCRRRRARRARAAAAARGGGPARRADALAIDPDQVTVEDVREAGPVHVGHQMWRALTLDAILAAAGLSGAGARAHRSDDAEPAGEPGRGTRHARLDPAHGAGRHPGHGLHHAQRRGAVSQSRSAASAARRDRAGAGRARAHAVQSRRHDLPLRPDVDVLRRPVPAQPPGQARLFARSPAGLQAGRDRAGPGSATGFPRRTKSSTAIARTGPPWTTMLPRSEQRTGPPGRRHGRGRSRAWPSRRTWPRSGRGGTTTSWPARYPANARAHQDAFDDEAGWTEVDPRPLAAQPGAEEDARRHQARRRSATRSTSSAAVRRASRRIGPSATSTSSGSWPISPNSRRASRRAACATPARSTRPSAGSRSATRASRATTRSPTTRRRAR